MDEFPTIHSEHGSEVMGKQAIEIARYINQFGGQPVKQADIERHFHPKPVMEALEHGKTGTLVDFFDVPGWLAALTEALAHPDRYLPLREAARQRALERYDLRSNCLPRMVDFVESFAPQR